MRIKSLFLTVAAALGLAITANAANAGKLGDPAPALDVSEWVKGSAVDVKDGKNVYVVEFWATWCPPCRTSIPHLTELQKKFKSRNVVIVGVSNETSEKVRPFVKTQADKMDYVVAVDKNNATMKAYMQAYGQKGIPCAFVVGRDGKVAWVGHPMSGLDTAIEKAIAKK